MDKPVRIQKENFSIEEEVEKIKGSSKRIGAVVTFLGAARDFSEGKTVEAIEFEQYRGMAEKALLNLRKAALKKFDVIDVRIVHRVCRILPGENIVLIATASEHRKEAFKAAAWCIDELKKRTPLWKKEFIPEGEAWVTPHP